MSKNSSLYKSKKALKVSNAIVRRCPFKKQKKKTFKEMRENKLLEKTQNG